MSHAIFSIIFIFFCLAGCGKRDEGSSSSKKTVPLAPEEMEEILDNQKFSCRFSEAECPYGIGRLFIVNPSNVSASSVCTGFLVQGNRLLTNHHCVSTENECRNTYISIRTRTGPAKAHCRSIIFTQEDSQVPGQRSTDLTVMEIDTNLPGPYFRISDEKFLPERKLIAWVVDHVSVTEALVTRLDCDYATKDASMVLRNCPAISGNSGSPLIDGPSGEVAGILWGSNLPPTIDASFPFDLRTALPSIGVATELFPFRSMISGGDSSLR